MNKEQLFMVMLEDYSKPRYRAGGRPYVGTKAELEAFADRLEGRWDVRARYKDLIQGIRQYDTSPDAVHYAGGVAYQIMRPVEEVYRREFTLENHKWTYETCQENLYRLSADLVGISQILVKGDSFYLRCSRARFVGLAVSYLRSGWLHLLDGTFGFPEMIQLEDKEGPRYSMSLSIGQQAYFLDDKDAAYESMTGLLDYDMTDVTSDIMAMG